MKGGGVCTKRGEGQIATLKRVEIIQAGEPRLLKRKGKKATLLGKHTGCKIPATKMITHNRERRNLFLSSKPREKD